MKTHHSSAIPCGLLLIALYGFIHYHISRRRFSRRGIAGLQQFRSYRRFVVTTAIERILMIAANLCGLAGALLLAIAGINHFKF